MGILFKLGLRQPKPPSRPVERVHVPGVGTGVVLGPQRAPAPRAEPVREALEIAAPTPTRPPQPATREPERATTAPPRQREESPWSKAAATRRAAAARKAEPTPPPANGPSKNQALPKKVRPPPPPPKPKTPPYRVGQGDPLSAKGLMHRTQLLAEDIPNRVFGTEANKEGADWIARQMREIGLEPATPDGFFQTFRYELDDGKTLVGRNVAGILRGTDPKLADEYVIVAAHHDSDQKTKQGANDNATGTVGVLAIAEALKKNPPKRSVLFLAFDGEEGYRSGRYYPGRKGSRHYAAEPIVPLEKTAMLVNMDELGMVHLESQPRDHFYRWASPDPFARRVLQRASRELKGKAHDGYPEQPQENQFFTTDVEPLFRLGVPTVNLLSGRYLDNHSPADTVGGLLPARFEEYARLAHRLTREAADDRRGLQGLEIQPGGLSPLYPLVQERIALGHAKPREESEWLDGVGHRLARYRSAAQDLVSAMRRPALEKRAGISFAALKGDEPSLVTEPVLHRVREERARAVAAYRETPKNDLQARGAQRARLQALTGIEQVLSAAVFLERFPGGNGYYKAQVPARVADLKRGAHNLGLRKALDLNDTDGLPFRAEVGPARAEELTREIVSGLGGAISRSVFAMLEPQLATTYDGHANLRLLRSIEDRLNEVSGNGPPKAVQRAEKIGAFIDATVPKKTSKWARNWADENALRDVPGLIESLPLPPGDRQELAKLGAAAQRQGRDGDFKALERTLVDLYWELAVTAFGSKGDIDDVAGLVALAKPENLRAHVERVKNESAAAAPKKPRVQSPEVWKLEQQRNIVQATLELQTLFGTTKYGPTLQPGVRLLDVREGLRKLSSAAQRMPGTQALRDELSHWIDYLEAPVRLSEEAAARRRATAQAARVVIDEIEGQLPDDVPGWQLEALERIEVLDPFSKKAHTYITDVGNLARAYHVRTPALDAAMATLRGQTRPLKARLSRDVRNGVVRTTVTQQ